MTQQSVLDKPCEVCGDATQVYVDDLNETEPTRGEWDGKFYRHYEIASAHFFCRKHKRANQCEPFFASVEEEFCWLQEQEKAH